jgi:ABC-type transporter Mla MlaB component
MLRIETDQTEGHLIFRVAGKLGEPCVAALEQCWQAGRSRSPAARLSVDLSDVTSIDKAGWRLLRQMHGDGVEVSGKGLATQTILDELTCKEETRS